ncbi:MAG: protein kinase [Deltaproteobacteria bacterium]|nr:protein kinase [Deltaproteobacteria bacterium]
MSSGERPGVRMICPACNTLYGPSVLVCEGCGSGLLEIPDAPLLSGRTLDERYDVDGVVGTGGMGTVYRARQRGMEREVAIKVLHPHYAVDPRAVKRFFREAQAASRLIHPNIVTVHDFGRSLDGHLYMVMELLEGWTLGDLVHYRAPLSPALAIDVARQVCDALDEAHRQRLVHRDLKPDNILLTQADEGLWAKVLDFGIARVVRDTDGGGLDRNHSTVEIAGTPAYMSPEQILGKDPDPRSDLYSLGIILFEMLTRKRPFDDESSVALCMRQLNERPPRVGEVIGNGRGHVISEALERVIASLLEKQPADRPARARDVKALLEACPESALPFTAPSLVLAPGEPKGVGDRTTRAEHPPMVMSDKTVELAAGAQSPPLAEVIERFKRDGLSFRGTDGEGRGGASARSGSGEPGRKTELGRPAPVLEPARPRKPKAIAAVVVLLAEHPGAFASGELAGWLEEQRHGASFEVIREDRRVTMKVLGGAEAIRPALDALGQLQDRSLAQNVALRIGLAPVAGDDPGAIGAALDLARRLAVATTHGQVAVAPGVAQRAGLDARPQTTVFLPDGSPLECAVVRRAPSRVGEGAGREAVVGDDAELGSGLLWGRGLQLRRLGQICDRGGEEARHGPATALVVGPRGMGKSALLASFLQGRSAVEVRVSPLSSSWPGHLAARLVAAALGLPSMRGRASELDPLVDVDLADRERELVDLLLLDRAAVEPPTARALARLVVDALARRAGDGALVVAIDDVHFLDRGSRDLLQRVLELARGRPWCFVATARWVKPDTFLADAPRVDLRPLGLRAMNQLAEELRVPPRQRHALMAAAQGNPQALRLMARVAGEGQVPQVGQSADGPVPWLLATLLRAADPHTAERAWLSAALGEGPLVEEPTTQAARLYLEQSMPKELGAWLSDRLQREGTVAAELARALHEPTIADATRRAGRLERLGLYRLAALEIETALVLVPAAERASRELEIANLRARAGDVSGAIQSFSSSTSISERQGGERRPTALLRFARTLLDLGEEARADEALMAAEPIVRDPKVARERPLVLGEWLVLRGRAALVRGDFASAAVALQNGKEVADLIARADARGSRALHALVQEVRAELAVAMGDGEAARTNFRQARDAFRDLGQHSDALRCLVALGDVELALHDLRRANDTLRAASRLAATAGVVREEIRAEILLGECELRLSGIDDGGQRLRAAFRRVTVDQEDEALVARASLGMAHAMVARRLWADALRYAEKARTSTRAAAVIARAHVVEADAHAALEQPRKARLALDAALEAARGAADGLLYAAIKDRIAALDPVAMAGSAA